MKSAKEITIVAMMTALIIGGQLMLSTVQGVEIVTILLLTFSYVFGKYRGLLVAISFSLLRCFIFGFFPTVIILYLIYYGVFCFTFGLIGEHFNKLNKILRLVLIIVIACVFTVCFSLFDDVLTPLFYGYDKKAAIAYFYSSIPFMVPQTICTAVTSLTLFYPLTMILEKVKAQTIGKASRNEKEKPVENEA